MPLRHENSRPTGSQGAHAGSKSDRHPQIGGRLRRLAQSRDGLVAIVRRFAISHGDEAVRILVRRLDVSVADIEAIRGDIGRDMDSDEPTRELPGSAAKLAAMRSRAERGYSLFQSDDAVANLQ